MNNDDMDVFDFLINDEDEVMLLLYAREGEPGKTTRVEVNKADHSMTLYRTENEAISLTDVADDVFDSLQDADYLLVCEISRDQTPAEDAKIIHAYEAEISY